MGIIKATVTAVRGAAADQWKEAFWRLMYTIRMFRKMTLKSASGHPEASSVFRKIR